MSSFLIVRVGWNNEARGSNSNHGCESAQALSAQHLFLLNSASSCSFHFFPDSEGSLAPGAGPASQALGCRVSISGRIVQRRAETHQLGVRGDRCRLLSQGPHSRGRKVSFHVFLVSSSFPTWWVCFAYVQIDVCPWPPEGQVVN